MHPPEPTDELPPPAAPPPLSGLFGPRPWSDPAAGPAAPPASPPPPPPPPEAYWSPPPPAQWGGPPAGAGWGPPPAGAPWGAAPPGGAVPPPPRRRTWIPVVGVLGLLALVAAAALVVLGSDDEPSAEEPPPPAEWDARVAPIAEWVADERDLEFLNPVPVVFLDEDAYRDQITGSDDAVEGESDEEAEDSVALLRALGLVAGDVDLQAAGEDLSGEATLAYYSPEEETVYVRGTELTPDVRVTLAHELTHVLQDQHFDLSRLSDPDFDRWAGLRSVAEGDAERIEVAYAEDELTGSEREEYEEASDAGVEESQEEIADVPPALVVFFSAPYALGSGFLTYVEATGGDSVDTLLEDPPTEQELFAPAVRGTPRAEPVEVTVEAPDGAEVVDEDEFGPLAWYLLLASRGDDLAAMRVADGWGGDAFVAYREDDAVCVDVAVAGDDELTTAAFLGSLEAWVAQSPAGTATVEQVDGEVRLHACDPGADAEPVGSLEESVLAVPAVRNELMSGLQQGGATAEQAACVVDAVLPQLPLDQLDDPDAVDISAVQQSVVEASQACA